MGRDSDSTDEVELSAKPIIIANKMMVCNKCKVPLLGYGRKLKCRQCNEVYTDARFANYIAMINERFGEETEITLHVLRIHVPFADAIINQFKRAWHVEEVSRKSITTKNDKTGQELVVIEIVLEKYIK